MKIALSAAAVLAVAGAASAAPFNVAGHNHGDSFSTGLFASTAFVQSGQYFRLGGNIVAPTGAVWNQFRQSGEVGITTFIGARGGAAPDWSTVLPAATPGGTHIGDAADFLDANYSLQTTPSLTGIGFGRLGLGDVTSAQANIIGEGEYVWLGQYVVEGEGTISGSITVFIQEFGILGYELDGPANPVSGLSLISVLQANRNGNNVFDVYITDVPAPGAFALLGVAGLAASRRRR